MFPLKLQTQRAREAVPSLMGRLLRGEVPIGVASAVKTRRAPKCNFSRKPAEQVHHTQFSVALENAKVTLGNSHGSS